MKQLKRYIDESIGNIYINIPSSHTRPRTKDELVNIIKREIAEKGANCDLNFIDTSLITDMSRLFYNSAFDGNISGWDVSKVKDMSSMFMFSRFTGDISDWDTSSVKDMRNMFYESKFDGDISGWDVSKVVDMGFMFYGSKFNGDISNWDVSNVKNMYEMFNNSSFNGDISGWNVGNVESMSDMFKYAKKFKQDVTKWESWLVNPEFRSDIFKGSGIWSKVRDIDMADCLVDLTVNKYPQ